MATIPQSLWLHCISTALILWFYGVLLILYYAYTTIILRCHGDYCAWKMLQHPMVLLSQKGRKYLIVNCRNTTQLQDEQQQVGLQFAFLLYTETNANLKCVIIINNFNAVSGRSCFSDSISCFQLLYSHTWSWHNCIHVPFITHIWYCTCLCIV